MADSYNLQRFVEAQESVIERVLSELRDGRKRSHWMWYIFPQVKGLGTSGTAWDFAIGSRQEAVAYLKHRVLGPRLRDCARLVLAIDGRTAQQILGTPDDLKFRSSMTLFAAVAADNAVFVDALQKYFDGARCDYTLDFLERY
ncbi:DUF1810 domain-containing protein [Reyranella sp. CPCC 100927]|uniref:DUF1810 domain-containing protein n=1 Tax=Reyranella sp. CPCC 100927 TaxID=2599616 RepID=UPI0011B81C8F|nr:DUF1810 domain-containing protein [Reyranella sp. CPCC 100927]TWS96312.1 DUF1810 domain-containing protein [Reyranella sp. CPCC 100927]